MSDTSWNVTIKTSGEGIDQPLQPFALLQQAIDCSPLSGRCRAMRLVLGLLPQLVASRTTEEDRTAIERLSGDEIETLPIYVWHALEDRLRKRLLFLSQMGEEGHTEPTDDGLTASTSPYRN